MNLPLTNLLAKATNNKHTSGAALAWGLAKFGCPMLAAWFPTKKAALETTAYYLEAAAVAYGFVMAGDAGASPDATKVQINAQDNEKTTVTSTTTAPGK